MKKFLYILCFCFILVFVVYSSRIFIGKHFIAHAMGNYKGIKYTNSVEAYKKSYLLGFRRFEIDISLTKDNYVICFHPYRVKAYGGLGIKKKTFSYQEFKSGKLISDNHPTFTTFELADLINLVNDILNRLYFQPYDFFEETFLSRLQDKNFAMFIKDPEVNNIVETKKKLKKYNIKRIVINTDYAEYIKVFRKDKNLTIQVYTVNSIFDALRYIFNYDADLVVTDILWENNK